jgi:hypothetical protein
MALQVGGKSCRIAWRAQRVNGVGAVLEGTGSGSRAAGMQECSLEGGDLGVLSGGSAFVAGPPL